MASQARRVALYRFTTTIGRRWSSYLGLVLVVGLLGGVAMASVAAGRRTQSSYAAFLASDNPSPLTMAVYDSNDGAAPSVSLKRAIEHLTGVRRVYSVESISVVPMNAHGAPELASLSAVDSVGSTDGFILRADKPGVVSGRMFDASRVDEVDLDAGAARILHIHVGQILPLGFYTPAEMSEKGFGTAAVAPRLLVRAKVVGIVDLNTEIVEDSVDAQYGFIFVTPALVREVQGLEATPTEPVLYGVQFSSKAPSIATVERELVALAPKDDVTQFHLESRVNAEVNLTLRPDSLALEAFGLFAGLACLVLAGETLSRLVFEGSEDREIMRSLGAGPLTTLFDGFAAAFGAVLLGVAMAVAVAIALSPIGPIGPIRPVYPDPGFAADGVVLGLGAVCLIVVLAVLALALAYRRAPQRERRAELDRPRRFTLARRAQAVGMPISAEVGVYFALEKGEGRTAVPVKSVLAGTALAVCLIVATLTFASGFQTLVSHPGLYGWNWNYVLNPTNEVPPPTLRALNHDPEVAAWSGANYTDAVIDGQSFPVILQRPNSRVAPPLLSGHGLRSSGQIVLGSLTMALLGKHVGQSVVVSYGTKATAPIYIPPRRLTIVGTMTFPAIGYSSFVSEHTSMGDGALISTGIEPTAFVRALKLPDPLLNGPELVFVRMRRGVSPSAGRRNLQSLAREANRLFAKDPHATGNGVSVLGVQRPAEIVDYRSAGTTPIVLAGGLACGAIVALGFTLASSVRRRRRDIALLKALGFSQRQLRAAIAWQATVNAFVGVVIGVPLGVVAGRELWSAFARSIDAVPDPTVPVFSLVVVALATFAFANLVAVWPARSAASTQTALLLRAE